MSSRNLINLVAMMGPDKAQLLQDIKAGDQSAFRQLFAHYQPMLLLEAYYQTRCMQKAETIVHKCFTMLWKSRLEIPDLTPAEYLYKAVQQMSITA
jgi:RNA polymerase sigma-70 factor, ECF subfamily